VAEAPATPPGWEARRLADELERRLAELGSPERAEKERGYLKSERRHLGCSVPTRKAALQLLREARTWALVDGLAANVVGTLRERHPAEVEATLEAWSRDADHWLRRSSLLAYLVALRSGAGDFDAFARKADRMLEEREFFVRKAIGWVLRDTGRHRPELVVAWLDPRVDRAAGLTVREAVKHLPDADRERLLARR
jgi:3-methyladenine DNA glycosylase AlkD